MATRLKLDLWLTLALTFFSLQTWAVEEGLPDPDSVIQSTIEVEYGPEVLLPYRERRSNWSRIFGLHQEYFAPTAYKSPIDGSTFKDLFKSAPIAMIGLQGGIKYNLSAGSLAAELSYEQGSVSHFNETVQDDVTLQISRIAAHFGVWLDTLWSEPYVVPYVQGDLFQITYKEFDPIDSENGTSPVSFGYSAGLLFQLNWLDQDSTLKAANSSGLNNTYVDLYVSQTTGSEDSGPSFASDLNWGAGIRLEY